MRNENPVSATNWSRSFQPAAKFFRLAHLRRLKSCEQVAAVCYRARGGEIEFLLVRTRSGRWIFPKGSAEPGLTHAQAAALEAFEEAGVHGRMEEASFVQYIRRRRDGSQRKNVVVNAHLCEVRRLETPPEFGRQPTWFSTEKAKRKLLDGRKPDYGTELARVVDRAVSRIRRLQRAPSKPITSQPHLELNEFRPIALLPESTGKGNKSQRMS